MCVSAMMSVRDQCRVLGRADPNTAHHYRLLPLPPKRTSRELCTFLLSPPDPPACGPSCLMRPFHLQHRSTPRLSSPCCTGGVATCRDPHPSYPLPSMPLFPPPSPQGASFQALIR